MNWKILSHPLGMQGSMGQPVKKEWVATAISGAVGLMSSLFGGAASRRAAREARRQQENEKAVLEGERMKAKNQAWTDTASGQNIIRILQEQGRKAIQRTRGAAAVAGGTDASVAMEKELQNQKQAEVIANANAHHEDRKEIVDHGYRQDIARVNSNIQRSKMQEAEATAEVAGAVSDAVMKAGQALESAGVFGKPASAPAAEKAPTEQQPTQQETGGSPGGGGVTEAIKPNDPKAIFEHQGNMANKQSLNDYSKDVWKKYSTNYNTLVGKLKQDNLLR